jgi:hypothetical protein
LPATLAAGIAFSSARLADVIGFSKAESFPAPVPRRGLNSDLS